MATFASPRIDSLCSRGLLRLLVTGLIVQWLRQHFSDASNLTMIELNRDGNVLTWDGTATTPLVIEPSGSWDPKLTEHRPGVIIKPMAWKKLPLGIDDGRIIPSEQPGRERHVNWWVGGHRVMVLAGAEGEAEQIAAEVWEEINQFSTVFRRSYDFKKFGVEEVGEWAQLKEARDNYGIPIIVSYAVEQHWQIRQAAPLLAGIKVQMSVAE